MSTENAASQVWPTEPGGTCDWGDCDRFAPYWRWAADLNAWLPVCEQHVEPERRRAVAPGAIGTPFLIDPPAPASDNPPCPTCQGAGHLGPATGSPQRDYGKRCPACAGTGLENPPSTDGER